MQRLRTAGEQIVNEQGEPVLLGGINLVCKDAKTGYVTNCDESLFRQFRQQGYNVIRLGLVWAAVEPSPGTYDDGYLRRMRQQVQWAEQNELYVFLDMHQDLYSVKFGGGAPLWATLDDGLPHKTGDHWSDAYLVSPALNRAVDRFWANDPAADGVGLQDHYAAMWRHVAAYFRDNGNVIGYDLMNEPYPGSGGVQVMGALVEAYAIAVQVPVHSQDMTAMWTNEARKQELLRSLRDITMYRALTEYAAQASQPFEKSVLMPFYEKVSAAIRGVDDQRFFMLEPSFFTNMGIASGIETLPGAACVYAPHGYDLVVDTAHYENYNPERVRYLFGVHRQVQRRLGIPVLIGEWGAFPHDPSTGQMSRELLALFDSFQWSQTYWCWYDGYFHSPAAAALRARREGS